MTAFLAGFSISLGWLLLVLPCVLALRAFSSSIDLPD